MFEQILKRYNKIQELRNQGLTFQQIGDKYNFSQQRAYQIFKSNSILLFKFYNLSKIRKKLKIKILKKNLSGRECVREIIRARDKYTCQLCGKKWIEGTRSLDVHHKDCKKEKTKQYDNYEKEKDNMITLCHKCHMNLPEHRIKK